MNKYRSIDPSNKEVIYEYDYFQDDQVDILIRNTQEGYEEWRKLNIADRAGKIRNLGNYLREHKDELALIMTTEMGKPLSTSLAEVEKSAVTCEYYADNSATFLQNEIVKSDASTSYVVKEPLGVIFAVMPWNFPLWQVIRFLAPTLMAGNAGLLKHASNVPQTALFIEKAVNECGFPDGVFTNLLINSSQVERVIRNPLVKAVTVTGSEKAGASVASIAASEIKKSVLELGGSDPFIVYYDADLQLAAKTAVEARLINCGQSCIAAKRFIIDARVYDEFIDLYLDFMKPMIVGNPKDKSTQIGPLATESILTSLESQISTAQTAGGRVVVGGTKLDLGGYYYSPTVIVDVDENSPIFTEETFGPVAAITKFSKPYDAIKLANSSEFGLGASIWTSDIEKAQQYATEIQSGSVFINGLVKSDPRLPFGGIKRSGYGRELGSYGINEFVNIKTIWIK